MQALILNSGTGSRMGELTQNKHKSMVEIADNLPLIVYQINTLVQMGITDFVITTGYMQNKLVNLITRYFSNKYKFEFVFNSKYQTTNYIYSIYQALDKLNRDLLLLHGDLYFTKETLENLLLQQQSTIVIDTTLPQPEKDFKARVFEGRVMKIATYLNGDDSIACQPLYKIGKSDWQIWANAIWKFCHDGKTDVYAEEALNTVLDDFYLKALDLKGTLCMEVDTFGDLELLKKNIKKEGQ